MFISLPCNYQRNEPTFEEHKMKQLLFDRKKKSSCSWNGQNAVATHVDVRDSSLTVSVAHHTPTYSKKQIP